MRDYEYIVGINGTLDEQENLLNWGFKIVATGPSRRSILQEIEGRTIIEEQEIKERIQDMQEFTVDM